MEFKIISAEDAALENENNAKKALNSVNPSEFATNARKLRPEYTFENFVTGESNRFAFVSSTKVAESPCVTINPLYIFGDVGLGKTHLMMAIGHYVLDNNINTNVVYTTAQQFAEDYFMATSKKSAASLEQFYNYYRNADLLLVDDIQFLANKTATQEEFFKLFEYLFEKLEHKKANDRKFSLKRELIYAFNLFPDLLANANKSADVISETVVRLRHAITHGHAYYYDFKGDSKVKYYILLLDKLIKKMSLKWIGFSDNDIANFLTW